MGHKDASVNHTQQSLPGRQRASSQHREQSSAVAYALRQLKRPPGARSPCGQYTHLLLYPTPLVALYVPAARPVPVPRALRVSRSCTDPPAALPAALGAEGFLSELLIVLLSM